MDPSPYLSFATDLAYRAGRLTLGYFNAGVRPDYKPDDTPVTVADRAAEEYIRAEIERTYPGHSVLGEEFGSHESESTFRWIIDPIDGTKAFMRGVPLYGVLIGLEIEGSVRVGVAYYPGSDEMLCAAEGLGTWWNGRRAHVSDMGLEHGVVCYTTYRSFEKHARLGAWGRLNNAAYMLRGWSDSYGYLLVSTGRAEAMLDPVMAVWDCGPFPVILKEAGGYFGSWDGREGHTHGEGMACNAVVKDTMLALVGPD